MKYIIRDWANNICFHGKEFDSFEEGWEFIWETFPDGEEDKTYEI